MLGSASGVVARIAIGGAMGAEAAEANAGKKGFEFSHWIPNRAGGPRSIYNGNYVSQKFHYLTDPFRYLSGWRAFGPKLPSAVQQVLRVPWVYGGAAVGAACSTLRSRSCNERKGLWVQKVKQIIVETDLFEHREVKPHFINLCCFGEDFAAWLKEELSHFSGLGVELSSPIQEDYGWGLWASRGKDRFWIALSYIGDGPQEGPANWGIVVTYDPGLNIVKRLFHKPDSKVFKQLQSSVRQIVASNDAIKIVEA